MLTEQRIRALLFSISLLIFIVGLPFILSFALGYKFDRRSFRYTKTGLIVLKTQPAGANIYLDKVLLKDKTPTTLNELLPGRYHLRITLEGYYPWHGEVSVEPNKVTRIEKIILFSLRANIKQLNKEKITAFLFDHDKDVIYYLNQEEKSIWRSDANGERYEPVARFLPLESDAVKWKLSPDREKISYCDEHQIGVVYLQPHKEHWSSLAPFILSFPDSRITDLFWHSDSYHLIVVSDTHIEVLEAKPDALPTPLVTLTKNNVAATYDMRTDTLYFLDSQLGADGKAYDNLYKLELSTKLFPLGEFMKRKAGEPQR